MRILVFLKKQRDERKKNKEVSNMKKKKMYTRETQTIEKLFKLLSQSL